MNDILQRLRTKHKVTNDTEIGLLGTYSKDVNFTEDRRELTVVFSSLDVDIEDEIVLPKGLDFDYFLKAKSIYVDHVYDMGHLVGKLRAIHPIIKNNVLVAWRACIVIPKLNNPLAEDTLTLARAGGMGVSIGFIPVDRSKPSDEETKAYAKGQRFSSLVRKAKVLEVSLTGMPANIACGTESIYLDGSKRALIDDLVTKGSISPKGIAAFSLAKKRNSFYGRVLPIEI